MAMSRLLMVCLLLELGVASAALAEIPAEVSVAAAGDGFLRHSVKSSYQAGTTSVRVLLPDEFPSGRRFPLLFVLPVEAGDEHRYGDGLAEVKRHDLHNKHKLICVLPTFSHVPWYADHPTDPLIRQESYLLDVVLPLVRQRYPIQEGPQNCLLLGFSKSGWGAFSLVLRHPTVFGRAAAWDAPFESTRPNLFQGMEAAFGTPENFERYQITKLLEAAGEPFQRETRLGLFGYGNFRQQHVAAHERMLKLGIAHQYADGPKREHTWGSGWVPEAVEFLVAGGKP
jgi:S-formylglutathione hydrolase FrmB